MNKILVRLAACFMFPRERRRAFREKHLPPKPPVAVSCAQRGNDDTASRLASIESNVSLLLSMFVLEKTAPGAFGALCPPLEITEEIGIKLRDQIWASLWENREIRRRCITSQARLLQYLTFVIPDEEVIAGFKKLLSTTRDEKLRHDLSGTLSWVFRKRERYSEAAKLLEPLFAEGKIGPQLLRRLILCELRVGNIVSAQTQMARYLEKFGTRDLWRSYDLSILAEKLGRSDTETNATIKLGKKSAENIAAKKFPSLIKGKRVAVVGNGPQEVGSGNGNKIDSYDIVIRFNDFPDGKEFCKDYGSKTDVWFCACWTKTQWRNDPPVFFAGDIFYSDEYPDWEYIRRASETPQTVFAVPLEFYQKILKESGIKHPTNGAIFLAWLKTLHPTFTADDIFGFSFKSEIPPERLEHYYASDATKNGTIHNLDEERIFLRKIFSLDRD